ncbi:TnsA-like heteromeric transposase endonuclease subunit [Streptomyces sp. HC44]|uniref:TnsA-like heteromeric transposase endonuclease subunit n=2 Tax=Streptomyces scabichelini TaxID=2711217 RepID=A0A6G4V2Z4_9ACTN|nr:TnsA-like heteromeric transposase endonuclease subunit [Streptomyces scabichelini]
MLSFREATGRTREDVDWFSVQADVLRAAAPWRTFRWYKGQKHYSGTYWSSTMGDEVIYESRLELARLLYADFNRAVTSIVSQPFLLRAEVEGKKRAHVPDFLLLTTSGPVIVDVKPTSRLDVPDVARTLAWSREAVERRGWTYEVWSEPPEDELANIRFLAGRRRVSLFDPTLLDVMLAAEFDGVSIAEAISSVPDYPEARVRACLLHLMWRKRWVTSMLRPLGDRNVLRRG